MSSFGFPMWGLVLFQSLGFGVWVLASGVKVSLAGLLGIS